MGFKPEFLPLTYLTQTLSEVEQQALNPFAEQESVDARFVEETALKQTFIHLGSLMKDGRTGGGRGDGRSEGGEEELRGGMEGGEGRCGTTMWRSVDMPYWGEIRTSCGRTLTLPENSGSGGVVLGERRPPELRESAPLQLSLKRPEGPMDLEAGLGQSARNRPGMMLIVPVPG
ncbi:unnamed protein product [Merluccius merluccius]